MENIPVHKRQNGSPWFWLLLIPVIAVLWPPFYNQVNPTFYGIPFFYWYQFLWVFISAGVTGLVYFQTAK